MSPIGDEPVQPYPPTYVRAWVAQRQRQHVAWPGVEVVDFSEAGKLAEDAPPDVACELRAWAAWTEAHAAWRARQPFDADLSGNHFRMFGGEWVSSNQYVEVEMPDGVRTTMHLASTAHRIARKEPEETVRAFAAHMYGMLARIRGEQVEFASRWVRS